MQAVRYLGARRPLALQSIPTPSPGAGEVLVRVGACGICHTELHFIDGRLDLGVAPLTLGHEVMGEVVKAAKDVAAPKSGDRVILYYYVGCGVCRWCRSGLENLCSMPKAEYGFISNGGMAEFIVVPARNAVPLPDAISDEAAAPIGCSVTTALHAAHLAGLQAGQTVVVVGLGGVGLGLVQVGHLAGAVVIALGRTPRKLALAETLGADCGVEAQGEAAIRQMLEFTRGEGADIVFDCVGSRATLDASLSILGRRGKLILIGYTDDQIQTHPIPLIIREAAMMGSVGSTLGELEEAVSLVAQGKIRTVVDSVLPLERFQEGLDRLRAGNVLGRIVLIPR